LSWKERKDPKKFLIRHQNWLCTGELTLGAGYGWRTLKTHPSLLGASKKHWKKLALHRPAQFWIIGTYQRNGELAIYLAGLSCHVARPEKGQYRYVRPIAKLL
jgi:hypothetical protein